MEGIGIWAAEARRAQNRAAGVMDSLQPGERRLYEYSLTAVSEPAELAALQALNK